MANSVCVSCLWEKETGRKIDTSRSKVAWAEKIGVSEASVRRHLKHAPAALSAGDEIRAERPDLGSDDFLTNYDIPIQAVTSRGMSIRDPETGSWEKVSWLPNKKALYDSLKYDDLFDALEGWSTEEQPPAFGDRFTSVLNASDLQIGKASQRLGGTPETIARVRQSFEAMRAKLIAGPTPERLLLVDGGDGIENVWNTPSQLVTNDLPVPEQIRVFRRLMLEGIKLLAPLVPELVYVAVPSNHGSARVGYKADGGTVDADFGLEVSYQLEDAIGENPYLTNVSFVRPESLGEVAEVATSGTRLAFHHGHQSSGPTGHGKWWQGLDHGRMAGWNADILVTAHFHSMRVEQSGNGRWIIGVSSSDAGSDWFTNRTGQSALQGMTAFDVADGQWSNLRII